LLVFIELPRLPVEENAKGMPPFLFAPLEMELRSPKHLQRNLQRVMLSCI